MAVKILDNCCSPVYLDYLKFTAINSKNWNLLYPPSFSIEDKILKLDIIGGGIKNPILAGLALGLVIQIHEAGGQGLFHPEIVTCAISIKDKHSSDNIHTDYDKSVEEDPRFDELNEKNCVKIFGIINSDWEEKWGGGFFHNETSNYIKPTSFCIFDPTELHAAEEIFTDKKRFAIDFTVFRDQQSLEKAMKIGNK